MTRALQFILGTVAELIRGDGIHVRQVNLGQGLVDRVSKLKKLLTGGVLRVSER